MKTYNNLFDKICTYQNFKKAYNNAIKGKKHYTEVKQIERYKNKYLYNLLNEVKNGEYKVSNYIDFKLWSGHKWRDISKLPMRDRIVQHAIMIYCEPIFRETFIIDTFSSIKGRGIHRGLERVKRAVKDKNIKYVLEFDVHKCYPSLDQNILKEKLAKKFTDKRLLNLFYIIIDSKDKGVPIGNYTSQYFNNFYFNELDHIIKEKFNIKYYFRYCDDGRVFSESKEKLKEILNFIIEWLHKNNVEIKTNYQIYSIDDRPVNFLGYIIYRDHIEIRKDTKRNFITKCNKMDFNNLTDRDINVLGSYWGILKHCDARNLWFKYTGVKTFQELNIKVKDREFIKNIIDKTIIIKDSIIYFKKGEKRVKLIVDYDDFKNISISTSGEMLVEAAEQFTKNMFPFTTKIIINDKNYYIFT